MIGYTCKYTPVELLHALGAETKLLNSEVLDFEHAESLTHTNLCCHAKAFLQQSTEVEELVLVNCCDSQHRVHDVLKAQGKHKLLHLITLPHADEPCARRQFKKELLKLYELYSTRANSGFDRQLFIAACRQAAPPAADKPFLALLGARVSSQMLEFLQDKIRYPLLDLTCSGNRWLEKLPDDIESMDFEALLDWYAGALLRLIPCMRMTNVAGRRVLWENENLRGIIYHTVKFCDYYGFDYARLKKETNLPVLKLESDYTPQALGQFSTRLEAFMESLAPKRGTIPKKATGKKLYAGIDSGSTTTNMVVLNEKREIVASATVRTGAKVEKSARAALAEVASKLKADLDGFAAIVATGYGRNSISFADAAITEITCHTRGAHFLNPGVRTIVDIGGQDSKVICLDSDGKVTNFIMNDKCAAGTGRFLEMMARTLEMDIEELSAAGLIWKHDLTISSMCTVFAESEVISLIAGNHGTPDIVHGLNKAVAAKTASMVSRAGGRAPYMMTGGVARNAGVVRELEKKLGDRLFIPAAPDLCGALGAALLALEK
ncbi:MAG TPA: 2-hydroxyglutaryl-CoA dehydratase [Firmicutes bacterium]|nr:2-hydroxyglutaryl-CoA dehydratase [Bacillota bacterium]